MTPPILIDRRKSYAPYLGAADHDGSGSINSQEEVLAATRNVLEANDVSIQIEFENDFVPQAEERGWYFPPIFRYEVEMENVGCSEVFENPPATCDASPTEPVWPETIDDAIATQCFTNNNEILFPGFGVTTKDTPNPLLRTQGLNTCVGVVIYDPDSSVTLLGHFPTDRYNENYEGLPDAVFQMQRSGPGWVGIDLEEHSPSIPYPPHGSFFSDRMTFPLEWYVGHFSERYFAASQRDRLVITIISTHATPRQAIRTLEKAVKHFFAHAEVRRREASTYASIDYQCDSRTGEVIVQPSR